MEAVTNIVFLGSKITAIGDCSHEIKDTCSFESYNKPRQCIKKQRHGFANKGLSSQSYGFSSSHIQIESWTIERRLSTEELMLSN